MESLKMENDKNSPGIFNRRPGAGGSPYGFRGGVSFLCLLLLAPCLWARGSQAIVTETAEGNEVWQRQFDLHNYEPGTYNVIVNTRDAAGNEAQNGPFNITVDPRAGLPVARVVYPGAGSIIRQDINLIGVASGRFGVSRVMVQLDNGDPRAAVGTDYWNLVIPVKNLSEGQRRIRVQAFDSSGMAGPEFSVSFIIDRAKPAIELVSHKTGDLISGNVTITGQADDANGISSVSWSEDGESYRPLATKAQKGLTAVTFSFPIKTKSMEDGPVVYYLRAVDNTGIEFTRPYLFFVDNNGPDLQIFSPAAGEDVFDRVKLTGRIYDRVGLDRFYYELGKNTVDIPLRPGDPFWTVDLDLAESPRGADGVKVTAVDKSGNISTASVRFQDRRKVKVPTLVIDYPDKAGLSAMPPDGSIYGHIEPGFEPESVLVDGVADAIPAYPGFRISPDLIPNGRGSLKIYPLAVGLKSTGSPVSVRTVKPPLPPGPDGLVPEINLNPSLISVSGPVIGAYVSGSSFTLEGQASGASRLEFRLGPLEGWRSLSMDGGGNFRAEISVVQLDAEGPVHMELRTLSGSTAALPVYHPLYRVINTPEIQIFTPQVEFGTIHGNVTVSGMVSSTIPIRDISYSLDDANYTPVEQLARYGRAWFSLICDFTALNRDNGNLSFRITDVSGLSYLQTPAFNFDAAADTPALIVNSPNEGDVITESFEISGIAFDDDALSSVYWRILNPIMAGGSVTYDEQVPFRQISTSQSFQAAIPFDAVIDGENKIEIYAEDIYGVRGETVVRTVKVSTASPEASVLSPTITDYSRQTITIRGESSDANGIEEITISMDNGNTYQKVNGTENWNLSLNTAAYVDGVYSLLIKTRDNYGVEAISNAMINIDNTPPDLSIGLPDNGSRVGMTLQVAGRVQDNLELQNLKLQLLNSAATVSRITMNLEPQMLIVQPLDVSAMPQGEYILRLSAEDRAGNMSVVSRKITIVRDSGASEVVLYNPIPGMDHSGPLFISGKITGADIPKNITLFVNESSTALMEVDRYGLFCYRYPDERLTQEGPLAFSAGYDSPSGQKIVSKTHAINYVPLGPILAVDSHQDGDVITGRPWLSGRAWVSVSPLEEANMTRRDRRNIAAREVLISFDNGRSFEKAAGRENWKFRLETGDLPLGSLPILIRVDFNDGRTVIRRLILTVDTNAPVVETFGPAEDSTHRDDLLVYGVASDDFDLGDVTLSLRPGDKAGYSVPGFIQGLYLDANFLGATYADAGIGLSFFKDNVKLQFQAGMAPVRDTYVDEDSRFMGTVFGFKLLANIFYLPFDYFFGPDWSFFSMSLALGANFSYFTMDPGNDRDALFMGAVLGQWEFIKADLRYFFPRWKYARTFSLYLEPIFWFASSDVQAEVIPRLTLGVRLNIF
ncbi:MAG: neuraminidase [Treponema sp.]|jgi:hypothetical protein|nr:neuraminidase [Treponema sp.]